MRISTTWRWRTTPTSLRAPGPKLNDLDRAEIGYLMQRLEARVKSLG